MKKSKKMTIYFKLTIRWSEPYRSVLNFKLYRILLEIGMYVFLYDKILITRMQQEAE